MTAKKKGHNENNNLINIKEINYAKF